MSFIAITPKLFALGEWLIVALLMAWLYRAIWPAKV